jgi:cyclophilin family peptidyl-prolyl cis-trans isomerase
MYGRFWLSALVAAVALMAGCGEKVSKKPVERTNEKLKDMAAMPKKVKTEAPPKKVRLETSMGDIVIELNEKAAPVTVKNFLRYVEDGFYDGTIFHRVIPNFMIQGGGFTTAMLQKQTHPPIVNEAGNGLKNNRGTIAMAREPGKPDSATSQFFINHKDNHFLDYAGVGRAGYAVFGKVIEGMEVVDKIAAVKTTRKGPHANVPVVAVAIKSARIVPAE